MVSALLDVLLVYSRLLNWALYQKSCTITEVQNYVIIIVTIQKIECHEKNNHRNARFSRNGSRNVFF